MKSPKPAHHMNSQSFFQDFFESNKNLNPKFSFQYFSKKIGWPNSYLSDLIAGRKKLTIARAYEFSHFMKLNVLNQERLLLFAMNDSSSRQVRNAAARKIKNEKASLLQRNSTITDFEKFNDLIFVYRLLSWRRKKLTPQEILEEFKIPFITLSRVQGAIHWLEATGHCRWDEYGSWLESKHATLPTTFDHSNSDGDARYAGIEIHKRTTENFLKFIEQPVSPSTYHSIPVVIPRGQFMPVAIKILELRDWISKFSEEHLAESDTPYDDSYFMQLDLNLFPLHQTNRI